MTNKTAKIVYEIKDMKEGTTFHPSILCSHPRGNIAPAIRTAKEFGFIEVAYLNGSNQPVYIRTGAGK